MHYQVVARLSASAGAWDYYPYWAPVRDKSAAIRLASYAAQCGYEAAILQSVTADMLRNIAHAVVDQQDPHVLPSLRYVPVERVALASERHENRVEVERQLREALDPYAEGPDKAVLDEQRLNLETGPGGDVTHRAVWQSQHISLPLRMDVLRSWMNLRRRLLHGQTGGATDGAPEA